MISIYSNGKELYAEESNVPVNGSWGWTKPLEVDRIKKIFDMLHKDSQDRVVFGGFIPPGVIAYFQNSKSDRLVWKTEPCIKNLLFTKKAGIKTGKYAVPGLIWSYKNQVHLYAYKEYKGLDTVLYKPPFFNITGKSVCMGTAVDYLANRVKKANTFIDFIKGVEDAFWLSEFSHIGTDQQIKGSFVDMYNKSKEEFPNEFLLPAGLELKTLLDDLDT